jgi:hypothetical protein
MSSEELQRIALMTMDEAHTDLLRCRKGSAG